MTLGGSTYGGSAYGTTATAELPNVTDLIANTESPGSAAIVVTWTKADSYPDGNVDVHRSGDGGSNWTTIATAIGANSTSYTDTPPSAGKYYSYRIERYIDNESAVSNTDDAWSARSFSRSAEINSQTASFNVMGSKSMPRSVGINGSGSLEATNVRYAMQRSAEIHGRGEFQAGAEFEEVFPSQSSTDLDFTLITTPVLGFASEWIHDEPDMDDTSAFTAVLDAKFEGPVEIRIQYDGKGDGVPDYTTDKRVVHRNGQTLSWPEIGDAGWYRIIVSGMRLGDYIRKVTWGPTRY